MSSHFNLLYSMICLDILFFVACKLESIKTTTITLDSLFVQFLKLRTRLEINFC